MFKKLLVANRGEIALRIIRGAKELGIKTIAVYSEADKDSLHVRYADESFCIGPPKSNESYLKYQNLLTIAHEAGADAIHPGYGFLSENSDFTDACQAIGLTFIGPSAHAISMMGNKSAARELMINAGVKVVPGSKNAIHDLSEAKSFADEIGYPVLIKASLGGGGKGMRVAESAEVFEKMFVAARNEAQNAFGDPSVYIEKYILNPSHIEIQILADSHGNIIHLGERDCSIQRRHQKLLEETPSPKITAEIREKLGQEAIKAAAACDYQNAGTIEFLLDERGDFYFIEMNTRIQVEHPITEEVTGTDLIKEQIRIAAGEPISFKQSDVKISGHSIECRINAEDPDKNFLPNPGVIKELIFPDFTR